MKTRTTIFISALLALTSCGSAAQYAIDSSDQRFQDGIYYTPKTSNGEAVVASSDMEETDYLVAKTKNSPIFMKSGEKVDTLFIPQDKVARIDFNKKDSLTSVFLYDNDGWNTWAAYQPWYSASWYGWGSPFYSWGYNPWYYGGWYSPWRYGYYGWHSPWYYDPWYYGGWYGGWYSHWYYDPWYYGGWYDPWFYDPWYYGGWYSPWHSGW